MNRRTLTTYLFSLLQQNLERKHSIANSSSSAQTAFISFTLQHSFGESANIFLSVFHVSRYDTLFIAFCNLWGRSKIRENIIFHLRWRTDLLWGLDACIAIINTIIATTTVAT